ncbi:MAG: triphosphoribosyl-dephospho-CoA synthase [Planctomycetales bacterium]|nr:triphosphoribosyl-dephospho-CoA synthase [Planctomycetales bacterium]
MTGLSQRPASVGPCVTLACLWEATAAKPGNVHRGADFEDMTHGDFVTAAAAIGPVFDSAAERPLGELVLHAVQVMRQAVGVNTHLGTILLIAPLAKAAAQDKAPLADVATELVRQSTVADAELVYEAIRLASPGGMGRVDEADVTTSPQITLLDAMALAADRDLVARQYVSGFQEVREIAGVIQNGAKWGGPLNDAIVHAHVWQMARQPDSLIARKCGAGAAERSSAYAAQALAARQVGQAEYNAAVADLDFWLRCDGHRRNPGTTADLVGAALFLLLAEGLPRWPVRFFGAIDG